MVEEDVKDMSFAMRCFHFGYAAYDQDVIVFPILMKE